jgi:hypothetical protein
VQKHNDSKKVQMVSISGTEPNIVDIRAAEASLQLADDRGQPVPAGGTATTSTAEVEQDPSGEIQAQQDTRHSET